MSNYDDCHGHTNSGGCTSNTNLGGCTGHNNAVGCTGHTTTGGCTGHTASCPSFTGYVGPRTITWTNTIVESGEIIDLQQEFEEFQEQLNIEAERRDVNTASLPIDVLTDPIAASSVRELRDWFNDITLIPPSPPYDDATIQFQELIQDETIEALKSDLKDNVASECACDCNYSCTCDCNYSCTCNCNYCTCDCNYCTCDCNYSCTCLCNYSSDERLKTNIIYF